MDFLKDMEIIPILPQKIFKFKCDDEILKEVQKHIVDEKFVLEGLSNKTKNFYLLKEDRYKSLHDWFHGCLIQVKKYHNFFCEDIKITQSWANSSTYQQSFHVHAHPNSIISGIFYVNDSDTCTCFGRRSEWHYAPIDGGVDRCMWVSPTKNLNAYVLHKHKPKAGELVLFNSSLSHSVDVHKSKEKSRVTISFNSFPSGKIGDPKNLTAIEIEVK